MARRAAPPTLSPARLDLGVYRGDTLTVRMQLRTHGVPVNLTDADTGEVTMEFMAHLKSGVGGDLIYDMEITVLYPLVGILMISFPSEITQTFPGSSVWDMQMKDSVGRVRTILRGFFTVTADITY
jgi:hypothetical protein